MLIEFIENEGPKWNINDTPDYDVLYVVYNNKILEKVHCYNKYNLGYQRCVMEQKWQNKNNEQIQEAWEKAACLATCDHCGKHLLNGDIISYVNKTLCNKCEKYLDQYKIEYYENLLNENDSFKKSVNLLNIELLRRKLITSEVQIKATQSGIYITINDLIMPKYWNKKKIKLILEIPQPGWAPEYFQIPKDLHHKNDRVDLGCCLLYKDEMSRYRVNVNKWSINDNLITFFNIIYLKFQNSTKDVIN